MSPGRRAALVAAVVVAIVAAFLLRRLAGAPAEIPPAPPPAPSRPVEPRPAPPRPVPAKGQDSDVDAAAPQAPVETPTPPKRVTVSSNVPGTVVRVSFHHVGSEPESEPITLTCDAKGEASYVVPEHPDLLLSTFFEPEAEGFALGPNPEWESENRVRIVLLPAPPRPPPEPKERGISGRVRFPDGRPVPGVDVQVSVSEGESWPTTTDESGEYRTESVPRPRVKVTCPLSQEEREVDAGATGVDFVLKDHVVRLRFVDGKGRPFRGVWWHHETRVDGKIVDEGQNNPEVSLPAGSALWVTPSAPGYPRTVTKVPVEGPPALHEQAIVMEKLSNPGALAVRLRTDTGEPPARIYLVAKNEMGRVMGHVGIEGEIRTTSDGRVLFEGLPPGKATVEANTELENYANAVEKDYGLPSSVEALVEAGRTVPVDLVVPLGGKVVLTVRGPDGAVVAPGEVRMRNERGEVVEAKFWSRGADGGKSWPPDRPVAACLDDPIPPGRYTIEILRDDEVVGSKSVAIPRGETLEVEVRLER